MPLTLFPGWTMRQRFFAFFRAFPRPWGAAAAALVLILLGAGLPGVFAAPAQRTPVGVEPDMEMEAEPAAPEAASPEGAISGAAAPAHPAAQGAAGHGIKLFGTVEFRRPLSTLPGWLDVIDRNAKSPIFSPERQFNRTTTWKILRDRAQGKSPRDVLKLVNTFWNTWPYREDVVNWGKPDYWAVPAQFLKKSGDCEDYAIAKYFTLKELGIPPEDMRIVVLRDTIRNLAHAVLVVYLDGEAYVLDNLSNVVQPHSRLRNYVPQYSVNENGRWTHIKRRPAGTAKARGGKRQ
ncbi:MAG: transglutaminase-like cysteine peptidase [Desulfovibrio sp.]|nr:transglutaminase-like cysteine peptidase [Desulfovibrio sp.]